VKPDYARILVLTLCAEEAIIAFVYMYQHNWRMAVYWAAATVIGLALAY
jgi:hypothetical protein